jgi:outer membrane protein OmpA-like peptidoglycan-associated protein
VSLASFQIVRGTATFVDRSVTPPATLSMTDLDVRLRGLSNAMNARSQVQIKGLVAGGPLEISGILSPRMVNDATDVKVTSKGIDLTPLSAYCGKYAGFVLDKGKLDLALEYKVAKRQLAASNQIKVDQFTLGEATNSKDATKLPVKLGLAVLQDPSGLIELDVPVEGNVDDPDFRLSRVVWRAIGNVLLKAVISPFALLGKAFGGGSAKLDVVDFQAGAPDLTPGAEKSLQGLFKALTSRPALKVDIEGTTDDAADVKTLKLRELKRQAAAARAEKAQKSELTDEEYLKFVEKRWRALGAAPPAAAGAAPDPAAMEEAVLASVQLAPEALGSLRQERAEAARTRLVALGIDPGRLFLTQGGERAKKEAGARVYFTLK